MAVQAPVGQVSNLSGQVGHLSHKAQCGDRILILSGSHRIRILGPRPADARLPPPARPVILRE